MKSLNGLEEPVLRRLEILINDDFTNKFFDKDASLWSNDPTETDEIHHRMGWIDAPITSVGIIDDAEKLLNNVKKDGYSHAVVIGMGGSSLAPEVFGTIFRNKNGIQLSILDSTDPMQIDEKIKEIPLSKTLFIISSKSGTTAEVNALYSYFSDIISRIDPDRPGDHFIAITDPNTKLETLAKENQFRHVFHADPDVGGRYSALAAFGIVPAVLAGIDGRKILHAANKMRVACGRSVSVVNNLGFILGAALGEAHKAGRDKLAIITDSELETFGSWLEQLVAESSGKVGKGIVPIDLEPQMQIETYSNDRIFYYLRSSGERDEFIQSITENGYPVLITDLKDMLDIGGEIYKWEIAVATACSIMGVNPFNQPNVQESKSITNGMIAAYKNEPVLDEGQILYSDDSLSIFGDFPHKPENNSSELIISDFLQPDVGDYIGINAFLPRNSDYHETLQQLRGELLKKYSVPITLGYGPRFLHSTGQLHKGGKNNGIFLVFTQDPTVDFQITGEDMQFSTLEKTQALGDIKALDQNMRRVLRINLKKQLGSLLEVIRIIGKI